MYVEILPLPFMLTVILNHMYSYLFIYLLLEDHSVLKNVIVGNWITIYEMIHLICVHLISLSSHTSHCFCHPCLMSHWIVILVKKTKILGISTVVFSTFFFLFTCNLHTKGGKVISSFLYSNQICLPYHQRPLCLQGSCPKNQYSCVTWT